MGHRRFGCWDESSTRDTDRRGRGTNIKRWYSEWLRAELPKVRSLSPGRIKMFTSPYRPDRLRGQPISTGLISSGYSRVVFSKAGAGGRGVESDH
jgi:hypothetical protein